jgi:hypothetical protein
MVPRLLPCAVRADERPGAAPGRYRGAIFAGDNPYSRQAWVSLRIRSQAATAIRDAVAAVPDVRRGFDLLGESAITTRQREETAA